MYYEMEQFLFWTLKKMYFPKYLILSSVFRMCHDTGTLEEQLELVKLFTQGAPLQRVKFTGSHSSAFGNKAESQWLTLTVTDSG